MANRVMARKVRTLDGYVVLVADDYAKTYVEFERNPSSQDVWLAVFDTDEFHDIRDDVYSDKDGTLMFHPNGNPVSDRVFILEDETG